MITGFNRTQIKSVAAHFAFAFEHKIHIFGNSSEMHDFGFRLADADFQILLNAFGLFGCQA